MLVRSVARTDAWKTNKDDQGEGGGGSKMTTFERTYFMDDPYEVIPRKERRARG